MKVLMASTSFPLDAHDWRGRFIYEMAAAIAKPDIELNLWAPIRDTLPFGVASALQDDEARWLEQLATRGGIAHLLRNKPLRGVVAAMGFLSRLKRACRRIHTDVYHVNWLQTALGLPMDGRPAAITVLGSDYALLRVPGMVPLLRQSLKHRHVILMPNAQWMGSKLERLFGNIAEIRPTPFGIDERWFAVQREPVKDGEDWLVVSRLTRPKLGYLLDWGRGLFSDKRRLHLFGPMQEAISLPAWIHYHGPTHPEALQTRWFPTATGLLTLSQHDEGKPQIMLEAMAAGLPVIASQQPAHADLLLQGETGWLVENRTAFEDALQSLSPARATELGLKARNWIRENVGTWRDYGVRCIQAYTDLLNRI